MNVEKTLKNVYEKGAAAFSSAARVYQEAKKEIPTLTLKEVEAWLQTQPSYTRHKRVKRHFKTSKIISGGYMETIQADLMDMARYARWNNSYKYILVVIDVFSKMAFAAPIRRKNDTTTAFNKLLQEFPQRPLYLHVDRGTEFYNESMKRILQSNNIIMYSTNSIYKACAAERLIRTLRKRLARYFEHHNTFR